MIGLFEFTGMLVWTLLAMYVIPVIPVLLLMFAREGVHRIGLRLDHYFFESPEHFQEMRDAGDWSVPVVRAFGSAVDALDSLIDVYTDAIWPVYSLLPGVN